MLTRRTARRLLPCAGLGDWIGSILLGPRRGPFTGEESKTRQARRSRQLRRFDGQGTHLSLRGALPRPPINGQPLTVNGRNAFGVLDWSHWTGKADKADKEGRHDHCLACVQAGTRNSEAPKTCAGTELGIPEGVLFNRGGGSRAPSTRQSQTPDINKAASSYQHKRQGTNRYTLSH